jgi:hypothetical protein
MENRERQESRNNSTESAKKVLLKNFRLTRKIIIAGRISEAKPKKENTRQLRAIPGENLVVCAGIFGAVRSLAAMEGRTR